MIHVAIVEDIKEIREGLQLLIDSSDGFCCRQAFATAEGALNGLSDGLPDVVLMDIHLPGISGIEAVRKLKLQHPSVHFIMSTVYDDDNNVFESLKAGATGYILKKTAPERILTAITEVFEGGSPMSPVIARKVIAAFQQKNSIDEVDVLTTREKEVLKALAKGLRYKEIAVQFGLSMETIRTHARNIYDKLQVQSRTDALNKVFGGPLSPGGGT